MSADVQVASSVVRREFYVSIDGKHVGMIWHWGGLFGTGWAYMVGANRGEVATGFDSYEAALNRLIREVRPDVWREQRGPVWSLRYSTEAPESLDEGLRGWEGDDNERYPWRLIDPEGVTVNGTWRSHWRQAFAELQAAIRGEEW